MRRRLTDVARRGGLVVAVLAVVAMAGWMVGRMVPGVGPDSAVADTATDVDRWPPKIDANRVMDGDTEIGEVLINDAVVLALYGETDEYTPYERAVVVAERLKLQIKPRANMEITTGLRDGVHVVLVNDAALVTPLPEDLPEGMSLQEGAEIWAVGLASAMGIETVEAAIPEPWEADEPYEDKIVPIFSIGKGKRIGGARVNGPASRVNQTQAVVQIEAKLLKWFRVQVYVPVSTKIPGESFDRVQGVAVTAVGDLKL